MYDRYFFRNRKMTRSIPPKAKRPEVWEYYWCVDSDHAAVFIPKEEESIGEFSRFELYFRGWL